MILHAPTAHTITDQKKKRTAHTIILLGPTRANPIPTHIPIPAPRVLVLTQI